MSNLHMTWSMYVRVCVCVCVKSPYDQIWAKKFGAITPFKCNRQHLLLSKKTDEGTV